MFKKYVTLTVAFLLLNLSFNSVALAETKEEKDAKLAEKVKINVLRLGTGNDARVQVKLKDGSKLKGYISQINENSFVVVDEKTAAPTEIPFPQTRQVKGNNLHTGVKIAIGIGLALLLVWWIGHELGKS
jgi:hypothetical protein